MKFAQRAPVAPTPKPREGLVFLTNPTTRCNLGKFPFAATCGAKATSEDLPGALTIARAAERFASSATDYRSFRSLPLLAGRGIGDLPPLVQPELMRDGRLVEVMPNWRFRTLDLSLVHLGNRNMPRAVRLFNEFAARMAPTLFPDLPM